MFDASPPRCVLKELYVSLCFAQSKNVWIRLHASRSSDGQTFIAVTYIALKIKAQFKTGQQEFFLKVLQPQFHRQFLFCSSKNSREANIMQRILILELDFMLHLLGTSLRTQTYFRLSLVPCDSRKYVCVRMATPPSISMIARWRVFVVERVHH